MSQRDVVEDLPSGRLTFVFTDIEGSTERWELSPDEMRTALELHDQILDSVMAANGGFVFKHTGDGVGAVFTSPEQAAVASIAAQHQLQTADWGGFDRLRIRIGLHMGDAVPSRADYFGAIVNRSARIMDVANGDQIAVSDLVAGFLGGFDVRSVGEHQLRGIGTETIHLVTAPDLVSDDRPPRARVGAPTKRLQPQSRRIIGRSAEIDEITARLDAKNQAVTIVGPGGVGKTRVALEVGQSAASLFADGVARFDFVPLGDSDAVAQTVAEDLGARIQPGMTLTESIVNFLEGRRMLLIFDNCEHVADAVRQLGDQILTVDGPAILATSREPIGWPSEQLFALEPLNPSTTGVELFLERAQERDHSFQPTADDTAHIGEICARLDGIPLGIELAAASVRVLAPAELVDRLDDRFRILRGGQPGTRHETMRDTVLWSYEQLDDAQARLFDRLSVFAGGFSLDAVEAVCADDEAVEKADILDLLMTLVDKSMVVSQRGVGHIRFAMLGTLRQFAREQLTANDETDSFRERQADYFAQLSADGAALLITDKEAETWELFDREWSNIRASFETQLAFGRADSAARLLLELGWFATFSMRFEAFSWVDELFSQGHVEDHPDIGSLHGLRALGAYFTADERAVEYAMQGLELDDHDRYGFCRGALAAVALNNVHTAEESERLTTSWLEHLDSTSVPADRLWAEGMRTFHLCTHDPSPEAATHAAILLKTATESGSATAMALARWAGGMVASFDGMDLAFEQWRLGLDSARSLDSRHLLIPLITGLELHFIASRGDLEEVVGRNLATLEEARQRHYLAGTSHLFGVTAIVLCRVGRADIGARLLGAMTAHGHLPRENASKAVVRSLSDEAEANQRAGWSLSIDAAANLAIETLRDVQAELRLGA